MIPAEFSQLPLVAGPLVGLRAWRLGQGHLTGVHMQVAWSAGENVAICKRVSYSAIGYGYSDTPADDEDFHVDRAPSFDCTCGFYAYFNGTNTYMTTARVAGLVEGYGHLIVGSRGFRAEKAVIVALVAPAEMTDDEEFEWRSICAAYPDAEVFPDIDAALAAHPVTPVDLAAVAAQKQAS